MNKAMIKQIALDSGFKLKKQPCGEMDLNPYVYEFAERLINQSTSKPPKKFKTECDIWCAAYGCSCDKLQEAQQ